MRQLLPYPIDDVDPASTLGDPGGGQPGPWVMANMITSLDGAAFIDGRSGGLGGPADRAMFGALRDAADCILVGAGTVRAERYHLPRTSSGPDGGTRAPRLAILSNSLALPEDLPVFTEPPGGRERALVITTTSAPPERLQRLGGSAEVVALPPGPSGVDVRAAVSALGDMGHRRILAEGGPTILGELVRYDLLDEWFVTVSPLVAPGNAGRITAGSDVPPTTLELTRVLEDDGMLLLRYRRPRDGHRVLT